MSYPFSLRIYCRLTCNGGSDVGKCPCKNPQECTMRSHSLFRQAREDAVRRNYAHAVNPPPQEPDDQTN